VGKESIRKILNFLWIKSWREGEEQAAETARDEERVSTIYVFGGSDGFEADSIACLRPNCREDHSYVVYMEGEGAIFCREGDAS